MLSMYPTIASRISRCDRTRFLLVAALCADDPGSNIAASIVDTVKDRLYTDFGLRTLDPADPRYHPAYGPEILRAAMLRTTRGLSGLGCSGLLLRRT